MLRRLYRFLVGLSWLRKLAMSMPGLRQLAWRFVAGENLDAGVAAVRSLNASGITGSLNYVGTHVRDESEAIAATDIAIEMVQRIHDQELASHISIKPTQIGLDIDEDLCRAQLRRILERACRLGVHVRIDMEESRYVEPTLRLFEELRAEFGSDSVGIVIQSYLRDRAADLDRVVAGGSRVRIVKGGYWEPAVAYREKDEIDRCFDRDIELLLSHGKYPAIATHDEHFIDRTKAIAKKNGADPSHFEFQMLYGVRQDLQDQLVSEGYNVRCYVPFGSEWFPYLLGSLRRLPGGVLRRWWDRFGRGNKSSSASPQSRRAASGDA